MCLNLHVGPSLTPAFSYSLLCILRLQPESVLKTQVARCVAGTPTRLWKLPSCSISEGRTSRNTVKHQVQFGRQGTLGKLGTGCVLSVWNCPEPGLNNTPNGSELCSESMWLYARQQLISFPPSFVFLSLCFSLDKPVKLKFDSFFFQLWTEKAPFYYSSTKMFNWKVQLSFWDSEKVYESIM